MNGRDFFSPFLNSILNWVANKFVTPLTVSRCPSLNPGLVIFSLSQFIKDSQMNPHGGSDGSLFG